MVMDASFTPMQTAVLKLYLTGIAQKQIASDLDIGGQSVSRHMAAIYQKTRTSNSVELVLWAVRHGWLALGE
jgi:DNA-binding CsgD family transcriptional regulator